MAPIPPFIRKICAPLASALGDTEAKRGFSATGRLVSRLNGARLALDGSPEEARLYREAQKTIRQRFHSWSGIELSPFEFRAWRDNVPMPPAAREVFIREGETAFADIKLGLSRHSAAINDGIAFVKRFRGTGTDGRIAAMWANFTPVEAILDAISRTPIKAAGDVRRRASAIRATLDRAGETVAYINEADITTFGFRSFADTLKHTRDGLAAMTDSQLLAMSDLYAHQEALYRPARDAAIARWKAANPTKTLSDAAIMKELGFGPSLASYYTHAFDYSARSNFINYLADLALPSGMGPASNIGAPSAIRDIGFIDRLRAVVGASPTSPFRTPSGVVATSPEEAFKLVFPGVKVESDIRTHLADLKRVLSSSTDSGSFVAMNPAFLDKYLLDRTGAAGFKTDFAAVAESYIVAASRQTHLDPLTSATGSWTKLITQMEQTDRGTAAALADRFRRLTGKSIADDPANLELMSLSHGITGASYNAIFLANPGGALPNPLSLLLQGVPEAMRDGLGAGANDLLSAILTVRKPEFRTLLDETGLLSTFNYAPDELRGITSRFWAAAESGDIRGAWQATKEWGGSYLNFLGLAESLVVRPTGAALGAARYLRRNRLIGVPIGSLPMEHRMGMIREMFNTVEKMTILPGSANTIPLVNGLRRMPVIGPLSTMFLSSPTTFASYMATNFKMMLVGKGAARGEATRVWLAQAAAGTLVAGPFWWFPALREMQKVPGFTHEDSEAFIGSMNAIERRFSLAGWLHTDLARRINPLTGTFERFTEGSVATAVLGPLGRPAADIVDSFMGDEAARRRMSGAFAPLLFDLPPSQTLPSAAQSLIPGAVGLDRLLRISLSTTTDPRGYMSIGPLGIPVKNPSGFRVDHLGRPTSAVSTTGEFRRFIFGSRAVLDAQDAAEGVRASKRGDARASVESVLRRQILDGDMPGALATYRDNTDLQPTITLSELQRESIMRKLTPKARAIYVSPITDIIPRVRQAANRLAAGQVSGAEAIEERTILMLGLMRLRSAKEPKGVVLGGAP